MNNIELRLRCNCSYLQKCCDSVKLFAQIKFPWSFTESMYDTTKYAAQRVVSKLPHYVSSSCVTLTSLPFLVSELKCTKCLGSL